MTPTPHPTPHPTPRPTVTTPAGVARPRPLDPASQRIWDIAATVTDPEIPVLTIADLGVLRSARIVNGRVEVSLTPTYSGCPALDAMRADVAAVLGARGYASVSVTVVLAPAWTTEWISAAGREKLRRYGIAAPAGHAAPGQTSTPVRLRLAVPCPRCRSLNTREVSHFGSTACKALYECGSCREPFDYVKVL